MSKPAARVGDMHMCPMVTPGTPPVPHVGGPIIGPGVPTVLICNMPAATLGDMCTCVGPPDTIALGSMGVFIGGKPAARMGDMCAHGGMITLGAPTVLIGEMSPGAPGTGPVAGVMGAIGKVVGVVIDMLEGALDKAAAREAAAVVALTTEGPGLLGKLGAVLAKGMESFIQSALQEQPNAVAQAMAIMNATNAMGQASEEGAPYADPSLPAGSILGASAQNPQPKRSMLGASARDPQPGKSMLGASAQPPPPSGPSMLGASADGTPYQPDDGGTP